MTPNERKIFNMVEKIKKEKLVEDTLTKIEEITKNNQDKNTREFCFIVSKKVWLGIAEHWGASTEEGTYLHEFIPSLAFRGFFIYWHDGLADSLFFGKLYLFEEPSSSYISKKLEKEVVK